MLGTKVRMVALCVAGKKDVSKNLSIATKNT